MKKVLLWLLILAIIASVVFVIALIYGVDPFVVCVTIFLEILVFAFARDILIGELKNVDHATEAADYIKKDSVKIVKKRDKFIVYERWQGNVLKETSDDPNKGDF